MKNILEVINQNKVVILKRTLIAGAAFAGLMLAGKAIMARGGLSSEDVVEVEEIENEEDSEDSDEE